MIHDTYIVKSIFFQERQANTMYFLTSKMCSSFTTASFYLPSSPAAALAINPRTFALRNPNWFKTLPATSFSCSRFSTAPITDDDTKFEVKQQSMVSEEEWNKLLKLFHQNDQQAALVSDLKSQYTCAIDKEDYENAVRLQAEITAATQNDAVGKVMSNLNKAIEEVRYDDATFLRDHTGAGLVGWWAGVSQDHKDPYGQIIHISPEHGRFVAKSYSPWQLATAKDGTPLFEIYVSTSKEAVHKEQAVYLKHEAVPEESRGVADNMNLDVRLSHLTPYASRDLWSETLRKHAVASGKKDATKETFIDMFEKCRVKGKDEVDVNGNHEGYVFMKIPKYIGEDKTVIRHEFAVGSIIRKAKGKLENDFLRVPAMLERKDYFSFSLCVDENNDQQDSGHDYSLEDYHTVDRDILDHVDCIGRGIFKEKGCNDKMWLFALSQAENRQPSLSGLITFNRIVPESSDPLNGIYIGSNGCLVTEVIQIRRKFGHWPGNDGVDNLSKLEPCNYVEVVNFSGDLDVPAGQVTFRAKVGEKNKLPPWTVLEQAYGAVARYKGEGRLTGFQESKWVDAEVFILGEEYGKEGFTIGFLFPAPDYYFLKLYKQLKLESFGGSH